MPVDPKAGCPFPNLSFAGDLDDIQNQALEVTMTDKWVGYLNNRVLAEFNSLHPGRLAFLRFVPDPENGHVIMIPTANAHDYGAAEIDYNETENGARVQLRLAVKRCNVAVQKGRVHIFPVIRRLAPNGINYLAFVVKEAATRPARQYAKSMEAAAAALPPETK